MAPRGGWINPELDPRKEVDVPLETLRVTLPGEPIELNGTPHQLVLDQQALAKAINEVNSHTLEPHEIKGLSVSLHSDRKPEALQATKQFRPSINRKNHELEVSLPAEVFSSRTNDTELQTMVREHIRDQLGRGVSTHNRLLNNPERLDKLTLKYDKARFEKPKKISRNESGVFRDPVMYIEPAAAKLPTRTE